ncbi:phage tail protein [Aeromonas salmonicida]|uniref:phage tail-collar fiber domain-containing protein n=1 Tax=Aeromonas salmonicida TaxID=645 RepID=UPI0038D50F34
MSQVITNAFEQYWQSSLAAEQPVVLDEFILADIPNLDITSPIDQDTGLPPESLIVHRQNVDQRGRINNNTVAYTIVMDTTVGDFSFNAMYLRNKANGVIGMIVYKGRETKLKTDQTTDQTGNSLVKSMLMGYDQAAEATLTNVEAGTWQIDYAARLRGQDEDLRQLASQLYDHHTFIGDGFKVVQHDGGHQVTQGVAIVGGLRIELKQPEVIHPGTKPIGVWVDVHRSGSLLSEHQNHFTIITSVAELADHVDESGYQHYVAKLSTVQADGTILDDRLKIGATCSPKDYGAVGDDINDDTEAILKALEVTSFSGNELDWGSLTYRITRGIDVVFSNVMRWRSSGAKIRIDPEKSIHCSVKVHLVNGDNYIKGSMVIDANRKSYVGFRALPKVSGLFEPDFLAEDLTVVNVYRSGRDYNDGDGMFFDGSFGRVHLVRPKVKDCHMAIGAGIHGSMGIFGISFSRQSPSSQNYCAKYISIEDPWIENIWSEDPAYTADQDGMRLFNRYGGSATNGKNNSNTFDVRGGRVINVRGRSLKAQSEAGRVSGLKLYRSAIANNGVSGVAPQNADIEIQTGGATVSDIEFQYDDFSHRRVIRFIQADDGVPYSSPNVCRSVRGVVTGVSSLDAVVMLSGNDGGESTDMTTTLSDVNVESDVAAFTHAVSIGALSKPARIFLTASGIAGKFSDSIFHATAAPEYVKVLASNIINRHGIVDLTSGFAPGKGSVTASNLHGVKGYPTEYVGEGSPEGVVEAVVGSTYRRLDGGSGSSFYIKESGAGSVGWV